MTPEEQYTNSSFNNKTMKKFKYYAGLLLIASVAASVTNCSELYDDTAIKNITDLQSRVEKLETWCTRERTNQCPSGLVSALEANNYVTGFRPRQLIKLYHHFLQEQISPSTVRTVTEPKEPTSTPIIGVAKDTDGE